MGGWQIRRNWAWEYLIKIGLQDLVRPIEILTQLKQNAVVQVPEYAPQKEKERETFGFGEWLRYRLLTSIEVCRMLSFHSLFAPPSLQRFLLALKASLLSVSWGYTHITRHSDHHPLNALFCVCSCVGHVSTAVQTYVCVCVCVCVHDENGQTGRRERVCVCVRVGQRLESCGALIYGTKARELRRTDLWDKGSRVAAH
jgi:hypothetical protein